MLQPDVCLAVVLDEVDNFLVIRRSARNTRSGQWEPPLGHRDPGESATSAALREVEEETGLSVRLFGGTLNKRTDDGKRIRLFLARATGSKPSVKTEPSEHDAHKWLSLDQMNSLQDCHETLKTDISDLLKANKQTKEASMFPAAGQPGLGSQFAPRFSGTYQPRLTGNPNPLASVQPPDVTKADTAGVQQALAKVGSMCRTATGDGPKRYKVNPEDTAIGEKAFESLDRFKRAGLNNFQASFFSRMVEEGRSSTQIKQAIEITGKKFGKAVAGELAEGFSKLADIGAAFDAKDLPKPVQPPPATGPVRHGVPGIGAKTGVNPPSPQIATPKPVQPPPVTGPVSQGLPGSGVKPAVAGPPMSVDPSNVARGGGQNFLQNYGQELNRNFNPWSDAWNRDTHGSDTFMKNLSRGGLAAGLAAGAGAAATGTGAAAAGAGSSAGLGGRSLIPWAGGTAAAGAAPAAARTWKDLGREALAGAGGMTLGGFGLSSAMPNVDDITNKFLSNPKLAPLLELAGKVNSGQAFDLKGMFEQNKDWLIPLLATMAAGTAGGGMLGGSSGALGGAIGLPLIYYLMQNPEALSQLTGGAKAPAAQAPAAQARPTAGPMRPGGAVANPATETFTPASA